MEKNISALFLRKYGKEPFENAVDYRQDELFPGGYGSASVGADTDHQQIHGYRSGADGFTDHTAKPKTKASESGDSDSKHPDKGI